MGKSFISFMIFFYLITHSLGVLYDVLLVSKLLTQAVICTFKLSHVGRPIKLHHVKNNRLDGPRETGWMWDVVLGRGCSCHQPPARPFMSEKVCKTSLVIKGERGTIAGRL